MVETAEANPLRLWLSLEGRVGRTVYWLKFVVPAYFVDVMFSAPDADPYWGPRNIAITLVIFWVYTVGSVKRFHDHGRSGWFGLVVLMAGILGLLLLSRTIETTLPVPEAFAAVLLIWLGFVRGTVGPNRYGPEPGGGVIKEWHWSQLIVAWVAAFLVAWGSVLVLKSFRLRMGYSVEQVALWWMLGLLLIALAMLAITWKWFAGRRWRTAIASGSEQGSSLYAARSAPESERNERTQ